MGRKFKFIDIFLHLQKEEQDRIRRQQLQQLEKEKIRQQQQQADYDYYYDAGCEAGELRETKVHIPTRCSKVSKVKILCLPTIIRQPS